MKAILTLKMLFIILLGFCILPGCGDDDDDDGPNAIVDTWTGTEIAFSECTDPTDNGTSTGDEVGLTIQFASGGSYTVTFTDPDGTDTETGTYTVTGSSVSICENGGTDCNAFEWSISGDILTLSGSDNDCTMVIKLSRN